MEDFRKDLEYILSAALAARVSDGGPRDYEDPRLIGDILGGGGGAFFDSINSDTTGDSYILPPEQLGAGQPTQFPSLPQAILIPVPDMGGPASSATQTPGSVFYGNRPNLVQLVVNNIRNTRAYGRSPGERRGTKDYQIKYWLESDERWHLLDFATIDRYVLTRTASGGLDWGPAIRWGKPTGAFSSGATVTLDPCDMHGTDNGEDNVAVYLKADKSSYTMSNSTTIATSEIVPFTQGDDGVWYVLGRPKVVLTDLNVDTANQKIQVKTRDDWGTFCGTESGWVDKHTGDVCA